MHTSNHDTKESNKGKKGVHDRKCADKLETQKPLATIFPGQLVDFPRVKQRSQLQCILTNYEYHFTKEA